MKNKNDSLIRILLRLGSVIGTKNRKRFFAIFLLTTMSAILEMLSVVSVLPFVGILINIDSVLEISFMRSYASYFNLNPQQLQIHIGCIFMSLFISANVIRLLVFRYQAAVSQNIGHYIAKKLYRTIISQTYRQFITQSSSYYLSMITTKVDLLVAQVVFPITLLFSSIILAVFLLAPLVYLTPMLLGVLLFIGCCYASLSRAIRHIVKNDGEIINTRLVIITRLIRESLSSIREIKLSKKHSYFLELFSESDIKLRNARKNLIVMGMTPRYIIETIAIVTLSIFCLVGIKRGVDFVQSIPMITAVVICLQRMMPIFQNIFNSTVSIKGSTAIFRDIYNEINKNTKSSIPMNNEKSITESVESFKALEIRGLEFKYDEHTILNSVNLYMSKGEIIGICGRSGEGKSTLLDLLMGLLKPDSGSTLVHFDIDIKLPIDKTNLRISHVPQQIFLLEASIAENIAFTRDKSEIDYKRVNELMHLMNLSDLLSSQEYSSEVLVGDNGNRLSGGQRQRLGIARALYSECDVMVLDEATSALDTSTEFKIIKTLVQQKNNPLIILVTHRLELLAFCTKSFTLCNGKLNQITTFTKSETLTAI